jgi:hypothetical protein
MTNPESRRPVARPYFVHRPEAHLSHEPFDSIQVTKLSELGIIRIANSDDRSDHFADKFVASDTINYTDVPNSGIELVVIPPEADDQTYVHYVQQRLGRAEMYRVQLGFSSAHVVNRTQVHDGELHMAKNTVIIGVKKVMPRGVSLPGRDANVYSDALSRTRDAVIQFKTQNARSWGRRALRNK